MKIQNIWCVGRNDREHAKELSNPIPQEPMIFLKAGSSALFPGEKIRLPAFSSHIDYELEIALEFNEHLQIERACLALDLTARDLQKKAKEEGLPWTLAKSFIGACPLGPFFPIMCNSNYTFELLVNGSLRQRGDTREMIFSFEDLIAFLQSRFPICPGDLLLTGTPSGVSKAQSGDKIEARIPQMIEAQWTVV